MLLELVEKLIWRFDTSSDSAFFDPAQFPWTRDLEAQWQTIRAELDALLERRASNPEFSGCLTGSARPHRR